MDQWGWSTVTRRTGAGRGRSRTTWDGVQRPDGRVKMRAIKQAKEDAQKQKREEKKRKKLHVKGDRPRHECPSAGRPEE